jgi:hypothetical protein
MVGRWLEEGGFFFWQTRGGLRTKRNKSELASAGIFSASTPWLSTEVAIFIVLSVSIV